MQNLITLSPNGGVKYHGEQPALRLLLATIRGIYPLERAAVGAPWVLGEPVLTDMQISALLFEPTSGLLFAGTHGNKGLWKSADGGATWQPCMNGITNPHIYTIAAQQRGDKMVLFVGVEPPALYRSDDLGESWIDMPTIMNVPGTEHWNFPPPPHIAHVKHVAFHPTDVNTYYVCIEQGALLKTIDDGATWTESSTFEAPNDFFRNDTHRTIIRPSNPEDVFLATGEGMYRSQDGAKTWEHITFRADRIGYPDVLYFDPRDEKVIYLGGAGNAPEEWRKIHSADPSLIRSNDNGKTWVELNKGLPTPVIGNMEAMTMYQWQDQIAFIAGTATGEVYMSENAGEFWTCIAEGLPPISKAGHYRHFMTPEQKLRIEDQMRSWDIRKKA